jgi:hypothetical protein
LRLSLVVDGDAVGGALLGDCGPRRRGGADDDDSEGETANHASSGQ